MEKIEKDRRDVQQAYLSKMSPLKGAGA